MEKEPYKQTDNKLNQAIMELTLIIIVALQNCFNSILNSVAMAPLTPSYSLMPMHTVPTPVDH